MATLESATAKRLLITSGAQPLPAQRALVIHPYRLPRYMHASWPSSKCHLQCGSFQTSCPHPSLWTATWNSTCSPTCNLCEADDDVQDDKHACSLSLHTPSDGFSSQEISVLIFTRFTRLFSQTGFAFLHQENNKFHLFIHELILLYEQASSHTS